MTREPTDMEERVARAICNVSNRAPWADENYDLFLDEARAAIRAMREPTPEMIGAEFVYKNCHMCGGASEQYPRMIDAASPEEK